MKLVKRIEIAKPEIVYTLGIKDDHNYIVNEAVVENCHRAKADVLRKILTGPLANVPVRWGLTGTMPEEDYEKIGILVTIGPVIDEIKTKDLQDKGILADLHINVWQLQDIHESLLPNYQAELKWLTTNKARMQFLANSFNQIAESGNTLILVDRLETGKMLEELIPGAIFLYSKIKSNDRKEEYKEMQDVDNKVIVATYGIVSTGINIPRIFNLVLLEPGKSFVRVIQSIGRGLRVTKDKNFVNVYDITSTCKYSKRHLTKRKKFYQDRNYEFSIVKKFY